MSQRRRIPVLKRFIQSVFDTGTYHAKVDMHKDDEPDQDSKTNSPSKGVVRHLVGDEKTTDEESRDSAICGENDAESDDEE